MNNINTLNKALINTEYDEISLTDLVLAEIYDLSELFGVDLKLDKNKVEYKLKMAMLGELINTIREKDIEASEEIISFLDEHNSSEELYQKIDFLLTEFSVLNPELVRSMAFNIPELLDLIEINIADELIVQRILDISDRLENAYIKLNLK